MHVVPAHLQGQPHQVRPMWTARQILGYLIRGRLMTRAAADERATANSILSWSFSAYRRDQWRISSNYNVVKLLIGTGYKPSVEAVRAFVAQFAWCSVAHTVNAVIDHAPRAQKIRRPSSGGGKFRGDFSFERLLSRTSTLSGQDTLPSPMAGCRIRLPESLLMLSIGICEPRRFVKLTE
jgi:hypothetical protein